MNYHACVVLIAAAILPHISCFSTWVPDSVCKNITPIHKGYKPQEKPPPYDINCGKDYAEQGDLIDCTIRAKGDYAIRGFMLQFFVTGDPVGSFLEDPDSYVGMSCAQSELNNTVTHFSPEARKKIHITYMPPEDYVGTLAMRATLLHNFSTYWVDVISELITVRY